MRKFTCLYFGCTLCRKLSDSHFQVRSFVKHLLWHQNYFGMDYPVIFRSIPLLCLTHPLILKFFQTPPPQLFNILKTPYPPFVNGGVQTMLHMDVSLCTKLQVSRMILTTFRQLGEAFYPPLPLSQNQPLKSPPRLGLRNSILRTILQCQKFSRVENFEVSCF